MHNSFIDYCFFYYNLFTDMFSKYFKSVQVLIKIWVLMKCEYTMSKAVWKPAERYLIFRCAFCMCIKMDTDIKNNILDLIIFFMVKKNKQWSYFKCVLHKCEEFLTSRYILLCSYSFCFYWFIYYAFIYCAVLVLSLCSQRFLFLFYSSWNKIDFSYMLLFFF